MFRHTLLASFFVCHLVAAGFAETWVRHTIDDTSEGADGVRLADVNGDDRLDIVTGWEEGGVTRLYLHPGKAAVRDAWPMQTLGLTPSVEDACFADLDGDGRLDVVSCCEGKTQTVFVHWNDGLDHERWKQSEFPVCQKRSRWMYAIAADLDQDGNSELVVGSKNPDGQVSVLSPPSSGDRRDLSRWQLKRLCSADWIMSLEITDIDRDGDDDIVVSDRYGESAGVFWLANPGSTTKESSNWTRHEIGLAGEQNVMFLSLAHGKDGRPVVAACSKPNRCVVLYPSPSKSLLQGPWRVARETSYPLADFGTVKSVAMADPTEGPDLELLVSCESASGLKSGLFRLGRGIHNETACHDIAGADGIKFDRIEYVDIDLDGDRDVLTCEERTGLGVIWYENPAK